VVVSRRARRTSRPNGSACAIRRAKRVELQLETALPERVADCGTARTTPGAGVRTAPRPCAGSARLAVAPA
jgi:hypothetical protein